LSDYKKVLITGASGFIGSHLVEKLVRDEKQISILLRNSEKLGCLKYVSSEIINQCKIFLGDIVDYNKVKTAVNEHDVIIHLASYMGFSQTENNSLLTIETNVLGAFNLIQAAKDTNVEKIVYISSSDMYGKPQYLPVDELHPLNGKTAYAISKISGEVLIRHLANKYNLNVCILRLFNTYGPRQSTKAVIPSLIHQALYNDEIVVGNTYPSRDFTYIDDTLLAIVKVLDSDKIKNDTINVGSGQSHKIGEIINNIFEIIGKHKPIKTTIDKKREKKLEIDDIYCNNQKIKDHLNWQPNLHFKKGLKKTINWYEQNYIGI